IVSGLGLAVASRDVGSSSGPFLAVPELVLDPNVAPPQVLAVLPHLGPTLVSRLVAARTERPFSSLGDLRDRVPGIGPIYLGRIAPHLRIKSTSGPRLANLADHPGDRPGGKARASRRKSTRIARRTSPPRPNPVTRVSGSEPQSDIAMAHGE